MTTSVGPQLAGGGSGCDWIREYGEKFLARYGGTLTGGQRRTLPRPGRLSHGGLGRPSAVLRRLRSRMLLAYNSCAFRNRWIAPSARPRPESRKWLDREEARFLLPVEYHHVVFTLPQEVAPRSPSPRPALLYDLLFRAAAADDLRTTWPPIRSAWGHSSAC